MLIFFWLSMRCGVGSPTAGPACEALGVSRATFYRRAYSRCSMRWRFPDVPLTCIAFSNAPTTCCHNKARRDRNNVPLNSEKPG